MEKIQINEEMVIAASDEQVSSRVADEEVILNLKNGSYYGLNPVGARIWELIQEPMTVAALIEQLVEEYEVTPEQCREDITALLHEMQEEGLVEVHTGSSA